MGRKNGALLWRRMQVLLSPNATTIINTGLTQPNRSFADYSPGEPSLGTPSRIQVIPLWPLTAWNNANISHGEPFIDPTTNTVHVEFVNNGSNATALNTLFWDPHSLMGPGEADSYTPPPPAPEVGNTLQFPNIQISGFTYGLPGDKIQVFGGGFTGMTGIAINGVSSPFTFVNDGEFIIDSLPVPNLIPPDVTPPISTTDITLSTPTWTVHGINKFAYGRWRTINPVLTFPLADDPRQFGYSLLLNNGLILLFGGSSSGSGPDDKQCYLYDPVALSWAATGSMNVARTFFAAAKLANGKILACGGIDAGTGLAVATAEVYDPVLQTWSVVGSMNTTRTVHTAILLDNGKVLVTGGNNAGGAEQSSSELFDAGLLTFSVTGSTPAVLSRHSAVKIVGGDVITISSNSGSPSFGKTYRYDVGLGTWSTKANMNTSRIGNTLRALRLPSGKIIVVAGQTAPNVQSAVVELYTPTTDTWFTAAPITDEQPLQNGATDVQLVLLSTGKAMRSGGLTPAGPQIYALIAEIYDEVGNAWGPVPGIYYANRTSSNTPRGIWDPLIVPILPNDAVFVIGGDGGGGAPSGNVEQFRRLPV